MIIPPNHVFALQADPKVSHILNLAIEAKADFLVKFDEVHLLALRDEAHPQFQELRKLAPELKLVKPAELAQQLRIS